MPDSAAAIPPAFTIPLRRNVDGNCNTPSLDVCDNGIVVARQAVEVPDWSMYVLWYAPDVAGVVLPLAFIALVLRVRRVVRTPREIGRMFCRRCNYKITPPLAARTKTGRGIEVQPGARCPECGVQLESKPPRVGTSARRRLFPAFAICLPLMAVCVGALGSTLEWKTTWAPAWPFEGVQSFLGRYAVQKRSPEHDRTFQTRISRWQAPSGERIGDEINLGDDIVMEARATPDGRRLIMLVRAPTVVRTHLEIMDLATGARRKAEFPADIPHGPGRFAGTLSDICEIAGLSGDASRVFVQLYTSETKVPGTPGPGTVHLLACDLGSLAMTEIASVEAVQPAGHAASWADPHSVVWEQAGRVCWATQIAFVNNSVYTDPELTIFDGAAKHVYPIKTPAGGRPAGRPRVSQDGRSMEVWFWTTSFTVCTVDIATGAVTTPTGPSLIGGGISNNGRFRFSRAAPFEVMDATTGKAIATLGADGGSGAWAYGAISDNGRFAAATLWGATGSAPMPKVCVWDLGSQPAPPPASSPQP